MTDVNKTSLQFGRENVIPCCYFAKCRLHELLPGAMYKLRNEQFIAIILFTLFILLEGAE